MATMVTPQTESFKRAVADLYGDRTPSAAPKAYATRAPAAVPPVSHGTTPYCRFSSPQDARHPEDIPGHFNPRHATACKNVMIV